MSDTASIAIQANVELVSTDDNEFSPSGLLNGGNHFEDVNRNLRRSIGRSQQNGELPQARLHASVVDQGLVRPTPKNW